MSEQRAITFCNLCHTYAASASLEDEPFSYRHFAVLLRDYARSQAMQAVEALLDKWGLKKAEPGSATANYIDSLESALDECQKCDYENPRIALLMAAKV